MSRRTIPQIRARMHELAEELDCPELSDLAEETKRRSPVRRAKSTRGKLTDDQRRSIRDLAEAYPEASYSDLDKVLDFGIGRISEELAGFR